MKPGISYVTVITTDVANNSSVTNLTVGKSVDVLYMDKVADPNQLWQPRITVTGYYSRTNQTVTVNGVKAKMKPDGHWVAENVPVNSPNGGTASFDITSDYDEKLAPSHIWKPAFLGEPTNGLRAGVSYVPVTTNEYNHYTFLIGVTNVSGTNQPQNWMLPSMENRFAFSLFDTNGKAVETRMSFKPRGRALPDDLNIHHLGDRETACIDGEMPLTTNQAVQLADVKLDKYFQIPPPGDYTLVVEARMFEIAGNGSLIPINFPPVKESFRVSEQPSETTFYLRKLEREGKLKWSTAKNSLRVGVTNDHVRMMTGSQNVVEVFLQYTTTNADQALRLPRIQEAFDLTLTDPNGASVPLTPVGEQRGLPLDEGGGAKSLMIFLHPGEAKNIERINLNEMFDIAAKPPGEYHLTFIQRLYHSDPTNGMSGLIMPMVVLPMAISSDPNHGRSAINTNDEDDY